MPSIGLAVPRYADFGATFQILHLRPGIFASGKRDCNGQEEQERLDHAWSLPSGGGERTGTVWATFGMINPQGPSLGKSVVVVILRLRMSISETRFLLCAEYTASNSSPSIHVFPKYRVDRSQPYPDVMRAVGVGCCEHLFICVFICVGEALIPIRVGGYYVQKEPLHGCPWWFGHSRSSQLLPVPSTESNERYRDEPATHLVVCIYKQILTDGRYFFPEMPTEEAGAEETEPMRDGVPKLEQMLQAATGQVSSPRRLPRRPCEVPVCCGQS